MSAQTPRVPEGKRPLFRENIAKSKVRVPAWEPFYFKAVGDVDTGGVLMRGAPPRILTRGPRKGCPSWNHVRKQDEVETYVANSEVRAAEATYEAATGNCHRCGGGGKEASGWSTAGTTYRTCPRCKGTGAAPTNSPADQAEAVGGMSGALPSEEEIERRNIDAAITPLERQEEGA